MRLGWALASGVVAGCGGQPPTEDPGPDVLDVDGFYDGARLLADGFWVRETVIAGAGWEDPGSVLGVGHTLVLDSQVTSCDQLLFPEQDPLGPAVPPLAIPIVDRESCEAARAAYRARVDSPGSVQAVRLSFQFFSELTDPPGSIPPDARQWLHTGEERFLGFGLGRGVNHAAQAAVNLDCDAAEAGESPWDDVVVEVPFALSDVEGALDLEVGADRVEGRVDVVANRSSPEGREGQVAGDARFQACDTERVDDL